MPLRSRCRLAVRRAGTPAIGQHRAHDHADQRRQLTRNTCHESPVGSHSGLTFQRDRGRATLVSREGGSFTLTAPRRARAGQRRGHYAELAVAR
jgi:hypothetical protein